MNLKWLAKHVLKIDIQENKVNQAVHDPVTDASITLKLYRKIPVEFWSTDIEIGPVEPHEALIQTCFADDFIPDYDPWIDN